MPKLSATVLKKRIAVLTAQLQAAENARAAEKTRAVEKVRALMTKLGVEVSDLAEAAGRKAGRGGRKAKAAARPAARGKGAAGASRRQSVAPKYRDPASGTTWSGRGRTPVWLNNYLAQGKAKEEFLIAIAGASAAG